MDALQEAQAADAPLFPGFKTAKITRNCSSNDAKRGSTNSFRNL
jgi:hypothetical protein